jgi:transitional endoplasmic reticulum ATPase
MNMPNPAFLIVHLCIPCETRRTRFNRTAFSWFFAFLGRSLFSMASGTKITKQGTLPTDVASSAAQLPSWFSDQYIPTFSSGAAHCFIVSGDVYGTTVQGMSQVRFIQTVLAKRRLVVAYYNRASGITFLTDTMKDTALQLIGANAQTPASANPMAAVLAASGVGAQATDADDVFSSSRSPLTALAVLERLLRSPRAKGQVAVIIDFADTLCPQMDKATMSADDRLLLVTLLSWGQDEGLNACDNPVFLLARQAVEMHVDLRSSGSGYKLIDIPLPKRSERETYLRWYLKQRQENEKSIALQEGLTVQELSNLTAGLNLRQIEDVLLLAAKSGGVTRTLVKGRKDNIISAEYSQVAEMIDPLPDGFKAIGGMDQLISWFKNELITPVSQGRTDVPKGVLLVGPPGTGKSFIVRALAKELGFNAVALKAENILGGRVGDSERQFRQFRQFCEGLAPVAVFFDEIDQSDMARRGNGSGNPVASNLFSAMLQWMSDETLRGKVIIFFASNRPDLIDPALLRLGRMDAIIPVLLPDNEARRGIVLAQARSQLVAVADEAITAMVEKSKDYSAADLAAVVTKARKLAGREQRSQITLADAEAAIRYMRPQTPQIAERYTLLAVQACNDSELLPPPYDILLSDREVLQAKLDEAPAPLPARGERNW